MKTELQEKLFSKYPKIFGDRTKPMTETCMCWGIETGCGWYEIIDTLCDALTRTYTTSIQVDEEDGKRLGIEPYKWDAGDVYYFQIEPPLVKASQVKEKFGTLRFYHYLVFDEKIISLLESKKYPELQKTVDRFSDFIDGIIHYAETASGRTCEVTGQSGELHATGGTRSGWLKVLNKDYAKAHLTDRNYVPYSEIPKYEEPDQTV